MQASDEFGLAYPASGVCVNAVATLKSTVTHRLLTVGLRVVRISPRRYTPVQSAVKAAVVLPKPPILTPVSKMAFSKIGTSEMAKKCLIHDGGGSLPNLTANRKP